MLIAFLLSSQILHSSEGQPLLFPKKLSLSQCNEFIADSRWKICAKRNIIELEDEIIADALGNYLIKDLKTIIIEYATEWVTTNVNILSINFYIDMPLRLPPEQNLKLNDNEGLVISNKDVYKAIVRYFFNIHNFDEWYRKLTSFFIPLESIVFDEEMYKKGFLPSVKPYVSHLNDDNNFPMAVYWKYEDERALFAYDSFFSMRLLNLREDSGFCTGSNIRCRTFRALRAFPMRQILTKILHFVPGRVRCAAQFSSYSSYALR